MYFAWEPLVGAVVQHSLIDLLNLNKDPSWQSNSLLGEHLFLV